MPFLGTMHIILKLVFTVGETLQSSQINLIKAMESANPLRKSLLDTICVELWMFMDIY